MGQKICIIQRMEGWEHRLSDFLRVREKMPFQWGVHDCMLFAGDAIEAITNVDFCARYRGKYSNGREAKQLVNEWHGGIISNIFYEHLGDALGYPLKARRGDVAMTEINGVTSGGVVDGADACFITLKQGLIRVPINEKMLVWSVG